jgi:hypothetical protein
MLRPATTALLVLAAGAYLAYKNWASYPNLIPNQRAVRHIDQLARRRGISHRAAYMRWANRRLKWSRYRSLMHETESASRSA